MKFTVEGATLPMPGDEPPPVKRVKAALESLPVGRFWTMERAAEAARLCSSQFRRYHRDWLDAYRIKSGFRYLYGSPKTIALWRKQQAKLASAKS